MTKISTKWVDRLIQKYAMSRPHSFKIRVFEKLVTALKGRNPVLLLEVGGGLVMELDPREHVARGLLFRGWHEELTTYFLRKNCRRDDSAVVAGAHIGYHVIHLARLLQTGRVVGFEPEPSSCAKARANILLNDVQTNVTLLGHGLADVPGYFAMPSPTPANTGAASFLAGQVEAPYHAFADTIEATLHRLSMARLDVLLLDVEGFEWTVLKGLGAHRPRMMVLETDPRFHQRMEESQEDFFRFVRSLGYQLFSLTGERVEKAGWYPEANIVALRENEPLPEFSSMEKFRSEFCASSPKR